MRLRFASLLSAVLTIPEIPSEQSDHHGPSGGREAGGSWPLARPPLAILDFALALPSGQSYDSLCLIGSKGAAYADDQNNTHLLYGGGHPAALVSGPGHLHIVREHQAFVDAVLHQTPPRVGGEVRAIHVDFYFAKDAGPPKGSRGAGEPPMDWLETLKAAHVDGSDGGVGKAPMGELGIEGAYPLAYIAVLLGRTVQRVYARTVSFFHQLYVDNDVEDLATVSLELDGGIVGSLCIGRIGAASHPDIGEIKLHIIGDKGALVVSEARPEIGVYYRDQAPSEFRHERLLAGENGYLLADDLANAIDTGGDTILDARASRAITATIAAALWSAQSGTLVDVP